MSGVLIQESGTTPVLPLHCWETCGLRRTKALWSPHRGFELAVGSVSQSFAQ